MHALVVGFGLGFFVAVQVGPMSLFLIRSTLRRGWTTGLAIGAGIAAIDAVYCALGVAGAGALRVTALATGVAVVRRAVGERAMRAADTVAGLGLFAFGGALAYGTVHDH